MTSSLLSGQQLMIVISGPSGVGKDSVVRRLQQRNSSLHFVVTATTRLPRQGEVDGHDYFFVSRSRFKEMIDKKELIEHAIVYGDYKGVPKQQVQDAWSTGLDVVMRLDVQGAARIKKIFPAAVSIFLTTGTQEELESRLLSRKSETGQTLKLRVATAREEMEKVHEFDYSILNVDDKLDETVDAILAIVRAEHHKIGK